MNPLVIIGIIAAFLFGGAKLVSDSSESKAIDDYWTRYDEWFKRWASGYGVSDWRILKAIALNESSLGQEPSVARGLANHSDILNSVSSDGKSWGLMQFTLTTANDFLPGVTPSDLNDPETSIKLAARYIARLEKMFKGDARQLEWTVKSYNQGQGNTLKEKSGQISGYAASYWARFQRNYAQVTERNQK